MGCTVDTVTVGGAVNKDMIKGQSKCLEFVGFALVTCDKFVSTLDHHNDPTDLAPLS